MEKKVGATYGLSNYDNWRLSWTKNRAQLIVNSALLPKDKKQMCAFVFISASACN